MTALSVCIPSYFILFLSQQRSPSVKPNHSRLLPLDVDHRPLHSIHLIPFLMSPLMLILVLCPLLLLLLLPVFPAEDDDDDNDIVHSDYYGYIYKGALQLQCFYFFIVLFDGGGCSSCILTQALSLVRQHEFGWLPLHTR